MDKKPIDLEYDYCAANVTWDTENNKDHVCDGKFTRHADDKCTNRLSVQVRTDNDRKKIIAREIAIHKVRYPFLPDQQIREKVYTKFDISAVMGDVLSRTSTILTGVIPTNPSSSQKKNVDKMPRTEKVARLEEVSEMTSQDKKRHAEIGNRQQWPDISRSETENSGLMSIDSEESLTPDFEIPLDKTFQPKPAEYITPIDPLTDAQKEVIPIIPSNTPIQSQPAQYITPIDPLTDTEKEITSIEPSNTSVHSQPTQVLTENSRLQHSRQAFGSMVSNNISNSPQPLPTLTPNYPLSVTQQVVTSILPSNNSIYSQSTQGVTKNSQSPNFHQTLGSMVSNNISNCSPPPRALSPSNSLSDSQSTIRPSILENNSIDFDLMQDLDQFLPTLASNFPLSDISEEVINAEPRCENLNNLELTESTLSLGSTQSSLESMDTQSDINFEELRRLNSTQLCQDLNKNLIAKSVLTSSRLPGGKRKRKPESLWTDMEESIEAGPLAVARIDNNISQLSNVAANSCNVSIGTNLVIPPFLATKMQTPDTMILNHRYREETNNSYVANVSANDAGKVGVLNEFSGNDISNVRNSVPRPVRKIKRRILTNDCYEYKENSLVTKPRECDESVQRSAWVSNKDLVLQTRRLNLDDSGQNNDTRSPELQTPAKKKVRLCSPRSVSGSPKAQSSGIARRRLTPFYAEHKSAGSRTLTPFYADHLNTKHRELTPIYPDQENTKQRVLSPVYSGRENKDLEVIDISDDPENEKTALPNVKEEIGNFSILPEKEPDIIDIVSDDDENISLPLFSPHPAADRPIPTELFSNRCCPYDYSFPNISSVEISPYVPNLLQDLIATEDKVIRQKIDEVMRFLETLNEDL